MIWHCNFHARLEHPRQRGDSFKHISQDWALIELVHFFPLLIPIQLFTVIFPISGCILPPNCLQVPVLHPIFILYSLPRCCPVEAQYVCLIISLSPQHLLLFLWVLLFQSLPVFHHLKDNYWWWWWWLLLYAQEGLSLSPFSVLWNRALDNPPNL